MAGEGIHYGLDRLAVRGNRVFGWGWLAHDWLDVREVALVAGTAEQPVRLAATSGLDREDVAQAFPGCPGAHRSGFTVTGFVEHAATSGYVIEADLSDGSRISLPAAPTERLEFAVPAATAADLARAVWRRLRQGDIRGIAQRVRDRSPLAPRIMPGGLRAALAGATRDNLLLVIDHDMGGGANTYRRELIDRLRRQGTTVLLFTCQLSTLDYRLRILPPAADDSAFQVDDLLGLDAVLDATAGVRVLLNSPVSFDDPLLLAQWLAQARSDGRIGELVVTAHDHFAICPSFVLLDADGRYCGIPDLAQCASCLPRHRAPYMNLSPRVPIPAWRASWRRCLEVADEIRCFSDATRTALLRAYPALDPQRIAVRPHTLGFDPGRPPHIDAQGSPVVGIVGHISAYKGAQVVADMVAAADTAGMDVRFVVFGTLEAAVRSPRLTVTGQYRREALAELIERQRANVFVFPSICPETFSYVVEELMALQLPVASFALGAQGDKVAQYPRGRLAPAIDAGAMLATALELHAACAAAAIPQELS